MPVFATSDGTKLYYEDTGTGPALVFCHSLNSSHLAIKDFIDEFRGEYRCICYDQRGHACSERTGRHLNVRTLGRDLRELLGFLGVEKACAIGHSMGAATLFSYVNQFGCAPFGKIVAVDMTPYMRNDGWRGGIGCGSWTDEDFHQDLDRIFDDVGGAAWQISSRLMNPALAKTPPELVGTLSAAFGAGVDPLVFAAFWYSLFRTDQRGAIGKIDVPFQYIQPETPLYGDETIAFYREHLRGPFRLETGFPGTTHTILQESPREVAARVKPFLRGEV